VPRQIQRAPWPSRIKLWTQQTMVGRLDQQWLDRQPTLKHALVSTSAALADCVSEVQRLTGIERKLQQDLLQARSSATSTTSHLAGTVMSVMQLIEWHM